MHGKFFINGVWLDGSTKFESLNPATEQVVGWAYEGNQEDIKEAVNAARTALLGWGAMHIEDRAAILLRAVDAIVSRYGEEGRTTPLKTLIHQEMGKMLPEADVEVIEASDMLTFFATRGPQILADSTPQLDQKLWPTKQSILRFEPVGVVALIKPWNYPFELPIWSLGAALIAGNTVVFKPSEFTPLVGLEIGKIFQEVGLPAGVLNIVTGSGSTGSDLVQADGVDMISFTGSVKTGLYVAAECAKRLRKVSLELGGKDPSIILEDADLELAANGLVWGGYGNVGQVCTAVERVYVHDSIADQLIELVVSKTGALRLGVDIAPLVSEQQLQKVEEHVADAVTKGAKVLAGGKRPEGFSTGFWYLPTVLTEVDHSMIVMTEETFGPVLPIVRYKDLSEAIELANRSCYGLGASVWTTDLERGKEVASQIEAGMVWINDVNVPYPQCPWGGVKNSGIGVELSDFGILEFTRIKHINLELGTDTTRAWWYPYQRGF